MEQIKTNQSALNVMRLLAATANVCMLITVEDSGSRRNRPMGAIQIDDDGNCWFFASKSSGKVKDISINNNLRVVFANPAEDRYLEIHGTGIVVCDEAEIEGKWSPLVSEWFPAGKHDPEVCLIRIDVSDVFLWDTMGEGMRRLPVKSIEITEQQRLAA